MPFLLSTSFAAASLFVPVLVMFFFARGVAKSALTGRERTRSILLIMLIEIIAITAAIILPELSEIGTLTPTEISQTSKLFTRGYFVLSNPIWFVLCIIEYSSRIIVLQQDYRRAYLYFFGIGILVVAMILSALLDLETIQAIREIFIIFLFLNVTTCLAITFTTSLSQDGGQFIAAIWLVLSMIIGLLLGAYTIYAAKAFFA